MRKIWSRISSLFFASVLTVSLTGKASADLEEPSVTESAPYVAESQTAPVNEKPAAETLKTEALKTETKAAENSKTEIPVAETVKTEAKAAETPAAETPAADTQLVKTAAVEKPAAEAPATETPAIETPAVETPVSETPKVETTSVETPVVEIPVADTPVTETPAAVTTSVETPVIETSVAQIPVIETPAAETPVAEIPVEEPPVEETPAAETPAVVTSALETPIVETPAVEDQSAESPKTEETPAAVFNTVSAESAPKKVLSGTRQMAAPPAVTEITEETLSESPAEETGGTLLRGMPDKSSDEGTVLNYGTNAQPFSSDTEVTLKMSGLQHISKLTSDGDVHIIGTGILLIDEVDLLKDCSVYLHPIKEIYGEDGGTVALFVKTGDGVYTLINSTDDSDNVVPAILDEEYSIPSGITLVVPSGAELVMQSVAAREETGYVDGKLETIINYSTISVPEAQIEGSTSNIVQSAPNLTIASGAGLVVKNNASFLLNATQGIYGNGGAIPSLIINGFFSSDIDLTGGTVTLNSTGTISGSCVFTGSNITVNSRSTAQDLSVSGSKIHLNGDGAKLGELNVCEDRTVEVETTEGTHTYTVPTTLAYNGSPAIGTISLAEGGTLEIMTIDKYREDPDGSGEERAVLVGSNTSVSVTSGINGNGSILMKSGNLTIGEKAAVARDDIIKTSETGGLGTTYYFSAVYDYSKKHGTDHAPNYMPRNEPANIVSGASGIPVISFEVQCGIDNCTLPFNRFVAEYKNVADLGSVKYYSGDEDNPLEDVNLTELGKIIDISNKHVLLEVCKNGVFSFKMLESATDSCPVSEVERIYVYTEEYTDNGLGGTAITATNPTYTGTGMLGGGAGSMNGGNSLFALQGNRTPGGTDPTPTPTPDPTPAPDPEPEKPAADEPNEGGITVVVTELPADQPEEFKVSVYDAEGNQITDLGGQTVQAQFKFTPPADWDTESIFVIFRVDGVLKAVRAYYDPDTKMLIFDTDTLGEFIVIEFKYKGEPFTKEFYEALEEYLLSLENA